MFSWTISKIFSRLTALPCKTVLQYTLKCSHLQTRRKSCWQTEMSGWIQAAMQQNTIVATCPLLPPPTAYGGWERWALKTWTYAYKRLSLLRRTGVRERDFTTKLTPSTPLWTKESKNSRPLECDAIAWIVEGWNFVVLVYVRTAMVNINGLGINWRRPSCLSMSLESNWKIVYIAWCAKVSSLQSLPPTKQHVRAQAS